MTSIYLLNIDDLNESYEKMWFTGTKNMQKINKLLHAEIKYLNINLTDIDLSKVVPIYLQSHATYDKYLSENIIFIDLFDAAANNVVLECILRHTPLIVTRLPGTIYYLGENYPMYFDNLSEISKLLSHDNIIKTHEYLKTLHLNNIDQFTKQIFNTIYQHVN